jgi:hypothetical protein
MNSKNLNTFICEAIDVGFAESVLFNKKPECPNYFSWRGNLFEITELISEWHDFGRKGRYDRNMKDSHLERASEKGSLGVGRFYFRIRTASSRVFDIYYDRSIKNVSDTIGSWVLFQELFPD